MIRRQNYNFNADSTTFGIDPNIIDLFMEKLPNIHPGEILNEEFLIPLNITTYRLAREISIPQTHVSGIVRGNRRITANTALRLSIFFSNSAKFWLGLQNDYDIESKLNEKSKEFESLHLDSLRVK